MSDARYDCLNETLAVKLHCSMGLLEELGETIYKYIVRLCCGTVNCGKWRLENGRVVIVDSFPMTYSSVIKKGPLPAVYLDSQRPTHTTN
jgi:hypothetical protein